MTRAPPSSDAEPAPRPRPLRAGPFGVLDVGTTKVTCLIGRTDADGALRVLGFGWQRGRGVRGGGITDIEEAERAIRAAVGQAEDMAELRLRQVVVNLGCGGPESRQHAIQWPVGGRPVTDADLRRIVAEARARAVADAREVIHALPLGFTVDDLAGVEDPRRLHCDVLTARLHLVDAGSSALRNLGAAVARCDLDLSELVSSPIAAGLGVLAEEERRLGATVIDMGGGTCSLAVFADGQAVHTAQLGVGGAHVTNDIARGLSTTFGAAERLKTLYGNAEGSPDDERELLPVPTIGEEDHHYQRVPRSRVVAIIRPRLEETFELLRDRLDGSGAADPASRVVLTGGASQLVGAAHMAGRILNRPVRLARPHPLRNMPDQATTAPFATACGLLAWAAGDGRALPELDASTNQPAGFVRRLVAFIRERV